MTTNAEQSAGPNSHERRVWRPCRFLCPVGAHGCRSAWSLCGASLTFPPRCFGPAHVSSNTNRQAKACGRPCSFCRAALAELHGVQSRRGDLPTGGEHSPDGRFRTCQARSQERITRRWSEPPPRRVVTRSQVIGQSPASANVTVGRRSLTLVVRYP